MLRRLTIRCPKLVPRHRHRLQHNYYEQPSKSIACRPPLSICLQNLQYRHSSSDTRDRPSLQELTDFTRFAVDFGNLPLATITADQWEHFLEAVALWFDQDVRQVATGLSLINIDKLVERLEMERATGSAVSRRRSEQELSTLVRRLLQEWLQVAKAHPKSLIAVERAQRWWNRQFRYRRNGEETLSVDFIDLVQAWLGHDTADAAWHVVDLLLHSDFVLIKPDSQALMQCIQEAMRQSMAFLATEQTLALIRMMDGLEGNRKLVEPLSMQHDESIEFADDTDKLFDQVLYFIASAGADERSKVEEWVEYCIKRTSGHNRQVADQMLHAMVDFYVQIKDANAAAKYLYKASLSGEQCEKVLQLCALSEDAEAPRLAEKILQRLERRNMDGSGDFDTSSYYALVVRTWANCKDISVGRRKVLDLMNRAPRVNRSILLASIDSIALDDVNDVEAFVSIFYRQWDDLATADHEAVLGRLCEMIENYALTSCAEVLVKQASSCGLSLPESVLTRLLGAFPTESDPDDVRSLLRLASGRHSLENYQAAVTSILRIHHKHRRKIDAVRGVLDMVFQEFQSEPRFRLDALGNLLLDVIDYVTYVQFESDATEILGLAEEKLGPTGTTDDRFPIPLDCYRRVAALHYKNGQYDSVEAIFDKVRRLYRAGHKEMVPDSAFYSLYMLSLRRSKQYSGDKQWELLEEVIALYKAFEDPKFMPVPAIFDTVSLCLKAEPTMPNARRGLHLLKLIAELDIEDCTSFPFNNIMHLLLKCGGSTVFRDIQDVFTKLIQSGVTPDSFSLVNVLQACLTVDKSDRDEALVTTLKTLKAIRDSGFCSPQTYGLVFKVLSHLWWLDPLKDMDNVFNSVLQLCITDGCLNDDVKEDPVVKDLLVQHDRVA